MLTIDDIRSEIERRAKIIDAPEYLLPSYGSSDGIGRPHIEVDSYGYYYVVAEKGQELDRRFTIDLDDLLYWVFNDATFQLGLEWELKHRKRDLKEDPRRKTWERQLQLLGLLSPRWREHTEQDIRKILIQVPYADSDGHA